jgi:DnaJ-class molecular chaperone
MKIEDCPDCDGTGLREYWDNCGIDDDCGTWEYVDCYSCKGSGKVEYELELTIANPQSP